MDGVSGLRILERCRRLNCWHFIDGKLPIRGAITHKEKTRTKKTDQMTGVIKKIRETIFGSGDNLGTWLLLRAVCKVEIACFKTLAGEPNSQLEYTSVDDYHATCVQMLVAVTTSLI